MILKIAGSILILFAGGMIGIKSGLNLKRRLWELKRLERIVIMLKGEIKYNNSTLPEALLHVGNKTVYPFDEMLVRAGKQLNEYEGRPFYEQWTEVVESYRDEFVLTKEQFEYLKGMGESLGYLDMEMQMNSLELSHIQIKNYISGMEGTMANNIKLYNCLGIMGGILVVLIIV